MKKNSEDNNQLYNVYLKRKYDLKFINVLYGVQIRSMAKHVMMNNFDNCDKNNIKIYYRNTDSILIRESDFGFMKQFISDKYVDLKVEGRYNNGVIISQGKYSLFGNDKNKIRPK
jgi:hypothetical protein